LYRKNYSRYSPSPLRATIIIYKLDISFLIFSGFVDATVFSIQAGLLMMLLLLLAGVQENPRRVTLPVYRPAYLPLAKTRRNHAKHFIYSKAYSRKFKYY